MKKIIYVLAILVGFNFIVVAQGSWRVVGRMPHPVTGGQAVLYPQSPALGNQKIYIFGGYSDSSKIQDRVNWIQEYDPIQNQWQIVDSMKEKRSFFVANVWKTGVLYFGGTSETSSNKYTMESWDFNSGMEPIIFDSQKNFGRSQSTGHIVGDNLYIIGGTHIQSSDTINYIVQYDLLEKRETFTYDISSVQIPSDHMTVIIGDYIYIFGGVFTTVTDWIRRFNIPQQNFEILNKTLLEVRAAGAAVYNPLLDKTFIIGGYGQSQEALSSVEVVKINPDNSLSITHGPPLNYARRNPIAVVWNSTISKIAVFGGRDKDGKVVPFVEIYDDTVTAVRTDRNSIPTENNLYQNYPNPFNPSTKITFELKRTENIVLEVFSILGEKVATLESGFFSAGNYTATWNGKDSYGRDVSSGIYFVRLRGKDFDFTRKMLLVK